MVDGGIADDLGNDRANSFQPLDVALSFANLGDDAALGRFLQDGEMAAYQVTGAGASDSAVVPARSLAALSPCSPLPSAAPSAQPLIVIYELEAAPATASESESEAESEADKDWVTSMETDMGTDMRMEKGHRFQAPQQLLDEVGSISGHSLMDDDDDDGDDGDNASHHLDESWLLL